MADSLQQQLDWAYDARSKVLKGVQEYTVNGKNYKYPSLSQINATIKTLENDLGICNSGSSAVFEDMSSVFGRR